jgi:hypothetical protein
LLRWIAPRAKLAVKRVGRKLSTLVRPVGWTITVRA